jgi:hypothetical protein
MYLFDVLPNLGDPIELPTSVETAGAILIPSEYTLSQNHPNPFNPVTRIKYSVPVKGYVSLKVYNLLGQEVATLFAGIKQPGDYVAIFDGSGLASGIYMYQLKAQPTGNTQAKKSLITKKLVLLK